MSVKIYQIRGDSIAPDVDHVGGGQVTSYRAAFMSVLGLSDTRPERPAPKDPQLQ